MEKVRIGMTGSTFFGLVIWRFSDEMEKVRIGMTDSTFFDLSRG